ncbi:MAG: formate--phosphoribosylaminoimidazolecarboxamide ligase [Candidatus Bathyarchaeia archaeon]|nr:formate--phosphoribosylaminoimidazolecarboxamide ligase [Candidatus Bathyarchaeota archaeon]
MISMADISTILSRYDENDIKIATVCSHSALQIFHGARMEGFATIGISTARNRPYYESFPIAKPDIFIEIDDYKDILNKDIQEKLMKENAIIIPHGSFVEYIGADNILEYLLVPMFGNRLTLLWEGDRRRQRRWFDEAGIPTPKVYDSPFEVDRRVIVKLHGAKGGSRYFTASNRYDLESKLQKLGYREGYVIEEYIAGVRYYPHFFLSPLGRPNIPGIGYGSLELLGIDRRLEVIDEVYRGWPDVIEDYLDFTVTGNQPVVLREKLLIDLLEIAVRLVSTSRKLFHPGLVGPFCIETIYNPKRGFIVFEVSARIVAGTNLYTSGSPYSVFYYNEPMSTGRRIAREIKKAIKEDKLETIIY